MKSSCFIFPIYTYRFKAATTPSAKPEVLRNYLWHLPAHDPSQLQSPLLIVPFSSCFAHQRIKRKVHIVHWKSYCYENSEQ